MRDLTFDLWLFTFAVHFLIDVLETFFLIDYFWHNGNVQIFFNKLVIEEIKVVNESPRLLDCFKTLKLNDQFSCLLVHLVNLYVQHVSILIGLFEDLQGEEYSPEDAVNLNVYKNQI